MTTSTRFRTACVLATICALAVSGLPATAQPNHAKVINVHPLWSSPYTLDGSGEVIGLFEFNFKPYKYHNEFRKVRSNIIIYDNAVPNGFHATQVLGLIIAAGTKAAARGIAKKAEVETYASDGTIAAYLSEAGNSSWDLSNHSYGVLRGWQPAGDKWIWLGASENFALNTAGSEDRAFGYYDGYARLLDQLLYQNPEQIPVIASGNVRNLGPASNGPHLISKPGGVIDTSSVSHPKNGANGYDVLTSHATAKNAIVVGAIDKSSKVWEHSSTGPTDDGRIKPDVMALGKDVVVCSGNGSLGSYDTTDGTSLAAPAVTATLALLHEHWENTFGARPFYSATARGLLIHTADDIFPGGPDYQTGWGRVDGRSAAIQIDEAKSNGGFSIQEKTLNAGDTFSFYVRVPNQRYFRATLAWTDPAGVQAPLVNGAPPLNNRKKMLINDLDMKVFRVFKNYKTYPSIRFLPYVLDVSKPGEPADNGDNDIDNVEQVYFKSTNPYNAQYGFDFIYKVEITHKGNTLSGGKQDFSLFLSGGTEHLIPPSGVDVNASGITERKGAVPTAGSAIVSWNPAIGAERYDMIYRTAGSFSWTAAYGIQGTEGSIPNLEPTTYQVKVRSRRGLVKSAWSSVTEFDGLTPQAPAYLWRSSVASTSAKISWFPVTGVTEYELAYAQIASDNALLSSWRKTTVSGTNRTLNLLTPDAGYIVYVRSKYSNNLYSDWSNALTFNTTVTCGNFGGDDVPGGARTLRVDDYTHGLLCQGDEEDWYEVENPYPSNSNLKVMLYYHPEPYRVSLYRQAKNGGTVSLVQGGPTGIGTKSLVLNNADFTAYRYFVQVWAQNPNTDYHNSKTYTVVAFARDTPYPATELEDDPAVAKSTVGDDRLGAAGIEVSPNPTTSGANIRFMSTEEGGDATVRLFDVAGHTVRSWSGGTIRGVNELRFDLADLPSGLYFVAVEIAGSRHMTQLNVVR